MAKYETFDSLRSTRPISNSFGRHLIDAISRLCKQPSLIAMSVILSLAASIPLYLVDYESGSLPVVGWLYAWVMGALIAAALIRRGLEGEGFSVYRSGALKVYMEVGKLAALFGAAILCSFYLAAFALDRIDGHVVNGATNVVDVDAWSAAKPVAISIAENTFAFWWKPMAHVAMGSLVTFAAFSLMLVSAPLRMRCRVSSKNAEEFVRERIDENNQGIFTPALILYVVGTTLVFVPLLNLGLPALAAGVSLVMYRAVLSWALRGRSLPTLFSASSSKMKRLNKLSRL